MTEECYLGIDLGGTRTKVGLVSPAEGVLLRRIFPTQPRRGPERWLEKLSAEVKTLPPGQGIAAAGVGVPVALDRQSLTILDCEPNLPGWSGFAVRDRIAQALGLPVSVENDANVTVYAEHTFGAAKGLTDFVVVTLGTGLGGGVMSAGRLITGYRGLAPEIGHLSIDRSCPMCVCGSRGCVELYVSVSAVLERASRLSGQRIKSIEALAEAVEKGEPWTDAVTHETADYLSVALASVVHTFNPQKIILAGGLVNMSPDLCSRTWDALTSRVLEGFRHGLSMEVSQLGDDVGILGAAMMAMEMQNVEM